MKTKKQLQHIAQAALKSEYGFNPALADITLLESDSTGLYILFSVCGHEYSFNSYHFTDGSIWVGSGTLEKRS